MMQGCMDGAEPRPRRDRRYRVIAVKDGWAVAINGATTRPCRDRHQAERLARRLQAEADILFHREPEPEPCVVATRTDR